MARIAYIKVIKPVGVDTVGCKLVLKPVAGEDVSGKIYFIKINRGIIRYTVCRVGLSLSGRGFIIGLFRFNRFLGAFIVTAFNILGLTNDYESEYDRQSDQ
jgi:hypothetical protein